MVNSILIIGGDERQKFVYEKLLKNGYNCKLRRENFIHDDYETLRKYDVIILPTPFSKDNINVFSTDKSFELKIEDLLLNLNNTQLVILGGGDTAFKDKLNSKSVKYLDLLSQEDFVLYNAQLTAEGTLFELMKSGSKSLLNKKVLVLGFGRVGKAVADILSRNKMQVFVAARSELQMQQSECLGYNTLHIDNIKGCMYFFDYIISTVPCNILSVNDISLIRDDSLFVELASLPYSAKKEWFEMYSKRYILASGLPGKYYGESCADKMVELILKYIS